MPRATQSPASSVLHFFRTASLDAVDLVLDLSKDIVRERKAASTEIEPSPAEAPAPRRRGPGRPKVAVPATAGNGRRRRFAGPPPNEATPLLPPQETVGDDEPAADVE